MPWPHRLPVPRSEEEFLGLGKTADRSEMIDGSLLVSARGAVRHQYIAGRLAHALHGNLLVLRSVNVRLGPRRIVIPDVVVTVPIDLGPPVVDAASVLLVAEVAGVDDAVARVLKLACYARAGIPWYLLVEPRSGDLQLHRLDGSHYERPSVTPYGDVLQLTEPVAAVIDTRELLPPR